MRMVRIVSKVEGDDNNDRRRYPRAVGGCYYPSMNIVNKIVYEMDTGPILESYEIALKVNYNTYGMFIWSDIVNETFCAVYDKSQNRAAIIICGLPNKKQVRHYLKAMVIEYELVIPECGVKECYTTKFDFDHYRILGNECYHTLQSFNRKDFKELEEFTMKFKIEICQLIGFDGTIINNKPPNAWERYIAARIEKDKTGTKINSNDIKKQNKNEKSGIKNKEVSGTQYIKDKNQENGIITRLNKGINNTLIMSDDDNNISAIVDGAFVKWLKHYKLFKVYNLLQCNGSKKMKVEITHIMHELKTKYFYKGGNHQKIVRQLHDLMLVMCQRNKYELWFYWLNVIVLIACAMLCGLFYCSISSFY